MVCALAAGCVETAECNAAVSCPDEQVCYEYTCLDTCETAQECGSSQTCAPCIDEAVGGEGKCFGEDQNACIPEEG